MSERGELQRGSKHAEAYNTYVNWDRDQERKKERLAAVREKVKFIDDVKKNDLPSEDPALIIISILLNLDDEFISEYGNWTREKYLVAVELKYSFKKKDEELLKTLFNLQADDYKGTIADGKRELEADVSFYKKELLNLEKEISAKSPNLDALKEEFAEEFSNNSLEKIKIGIIDIRRPFNAPIPICSICESIFSEIAAEMYR